MIGIKNDKYAIEKAFKDCFYAVPDFQREYVWDDRQVTQLLEDIDEQFYGNNEKSNDSATEYFIGTILVSPKDNGKDKFDIIDGQQRLTTIFLILCALRVLFKKRDLTKYKNILKKLMLDDHTISAEEIKIEYKLELQYEAASEIIKKIVEANGDPETVRKSIKSSSTKKVFGASEKILIAYDTIYHFLKNNYNDDKKLKEYWFHLSQHVHFIQISTDFNHALKVFETINERGEGLNPMDLLKNMLFRQVDREEFNKLKEKWQNITKPLEKNKERPLRFLRYFLIANYEIKNNKSSVIREEEIYERLSEKENAELTGYKKNPFDFVDKIVDNASQYINFTKDLSNHGNSSIPLTSLRTLTRGSFKSHYVLLLAAADLPESLFNQFITQLESFLFFYIFTRSPTNELERHFAICVGELKIISQIQNLKKQTKKLNKFIDIHFQQKMNDKKPELNDALDRLTFHSMQKYRIKYLLARLAQYVDMQFMGQNPHQSGFENYLKLEIEHILPSTPEDDLLKSWEENNKDFEYDDAKNLFGNLTLLEKTINIVAGRNFYSEKKKEYSKSLNYLTRSLDKLDTVGKNTSINRINDKLQSFETWNSIDDIRKRQKMLAELVHDIWKITPIT